MPDAPTYDFCSSIKAPHRAPEPVGTAAPTPKAPETLKDIKEATNAITNVADDKDADSTVEAESVSSVFALGACAVVAGLF
jgi:hypothetical protein